jgi:hypothetical protein
MNMDMSGFTGVTIKVNGKTFVDKVFTGMDKIAMLYLQEGFKRDELREENVRDICEMVFGINTINVSEALIKYNVEQFYDIPHRNIIIFAGEIVKTFMSDYQVGESCTFSYYDSNDDTTTKIELGFGEHGHLVHVISIETIKPEPKQLKVRTIKTSEHAECPITCVDIETKCTTNCGHVFEHSALLKALEQNETCPVCRAEVNIIIL